MHERFHSPIVRGKLADTRPAAAALGNETARTRSLGTSLFFPPSFLYIGIDFDQILRLLHFGSTQL